MLHVTPKLTNRELAELLLQHPDYTPIIFDGDNGYSEFAPVEGVTHLDESKQTVIDIH